MITKYTYNLVLQHNSSPGGTPTKSRSKYKGGFEQKHGRSNNTQAYNHDYYIHNKEKWHGGRPVSDPQAVADVNVRVFDMKGSSDVRTVGGYFTNVNPYQVGYFIDWNDPDSVFYDYKKFAMSAFENSYGGMAEGQKAAFKTLLDPSYGNPNRVLYDDNFDRYYVTTTDKHVIDLFKRSDYGGQIAKIGNQEVALYTYDGKKDQAYFDSYFTRQQAAKKLMTKSMKKDASKGNSR